MQKYYNLIKATGLIGLLIILKKYHYKSNYEAKKYLKNSQLPKRFRLEACTLCQLNCEDCYMRKEEKTHKLKCGKGYLKFKDFKNFIDKNNVEWVGLSNNGEIFLNPDLLKIMKYAHEKHVVLSDCNGVNLNNVKEDALEGLVKYEFERLDISLDGASQETYAQYRVGGNFNNVVENIKKINHYKKIYNSKFPHLIWKFIIFGHNEHEIPKAKQMAKELGIDIQFVSNWSLTYSPLKNIDFIKKELPNMAVTYEELRLANGTSACIQMWETPQINYDGQLQGCCVNYDFDYDVNVFKDGLLKSLNNPKFIAAKRLLTGKKVSKNMALNCRSCTFYKIMKKQGKFLK